MIISHKYRYIFIKTNKTAGTSVEIALSKHCGPTDIVTPISPEDEEMRAAMHGVGPQNYEFMADGKASPFFNHIGADEIVRRIGEKIWDGYFKFCIERNPFDRVISHFYWTYKSGERPTMSRYLDSDLILALKSKGIQLYTRDGKVAVDKVCRYEKLSEELEEVRLRLGIPEPLELPRAKSQFRQDKRNYRDILTEGDKRRIAEIFTEELKLFGYEF